MIPEPKRGGIRGEVERVFTFPLQQKNKMLGELRAYTFFAFRMVAVATISASADTIRKSADRLIVFLSAISLFTIVILPHLVESMPLFGKQQ